MWAVLAAVLMTLVWTLLGIVVKCSQHWHLGADIFWALTSLSGKLGWDSTCVMGLVEPNVWLSNCSSACFRFRPSAGCWTFLLTLLCYPAGVFIIGIWWEREELLQIRNYPRSRQPWRGGEEEGSHSLHNPLGKEQEQFERSFTFKLCFPLPLIALKEY